MQLLLEQIMPFFSLHWSHHAKQTPRMKEYPDVQCCSMVHVEFDGVQAFLKPSLMFHEEGTVWQKVLTLGKSKIIKCNSIGIYTFSSFKVSLRSSTIDWKNGDKQIAVGLCLSMDLIVSTEPCLADQLGDESKLDSSWSRSVSWASSIYCDIRKERLNDKSISDH